MNDFFSNMAMCEDEESDVEEEHEGEEKGEETRDRCTSCGGIDIILDPIAAQRVCADCGCVATSVTSNGAEWRFYGSADHGRASNPTRCGLPVDELLPKSSLTTQVRYSGNKYMALVRLHKWHQIHPEERSLFTVFKTMNKILQNVPVPEETKKQAKQYYKILSQKDNKKGTLTRGIIRKSFIAACIFIACKNNNMPYQKCKIAEICGITKADMTKGFKKFNCLERNKNIQISKPTKESAHNFIHRFCNTLMFSEVMRDMAHILYDRIHTLGMLKDIHELSIIAGLLYYITVIFHNTNEYKPRILNIIQVSVVTLEKVFKIINKNSVYLMIGLNEFVKSQK